MTRKKAGGFIFESCKADHAPLHVHVLDSNDNFLCRFDIENQSPMEKGFVLTNKLKKALEIGGYIRGKDVNADKV